MIRLIFICLVFLLPFLSKAQDAGFQWAHSFGSITADEAHGITTDNEGNVYVVGNFIETIGFDLDGDIVELESEGASDGYVAKYNSDGDFEWATMIGSEDFDSGYAIEYSPDGTILIGGGFRETVDFDPGPEVYEVTAEGGTDAYILRLNTDGEFISVITFGSSLSSEIVFELSTDESGNIYSVGRFSGITDFDPGADVFELTPIGEEDLFIQKLGSEGSFIWVGAIGGEVEGLDSDIVIDNLGNVFVSGQFEGEIDIDPGVDLLLLTPIGFRDGFVVKLNSDGDYIWHEIISGTGGDEIFGIAVDSDNSLFVTGFFFNTVDFDPGPLVDNKTSLGSGDSFIQKLDTDGNLEWILTHGGSSSDRGKEIIINSEDQIYLIGNYQETVDFDPDGMGDEHMAVDAVDMYMQCLNNDGEILWTKTMGGEDLEIGIGISVDLLGNIYGMSALYETADFNPGFEEHELTSVGSRDIAVVKLSPCEANTGTDEITACNSYTWIDGETYTENNNTATWLLSNSGGCDSLVTLDLTILHLNDGVSASGGTLTSDDPDAEYQWLDCNDGFSEIAGETNQDFTPTEEGNYAVKITEEECSDTSDCVLVEGIGIDEYQMTSVVKIYPNPAKDFVQIESQLFAFNEIKVFDLSGVLVYQQNIEETALTVLNISGFARGIYILEIVSDQYADRARFVLE